MPVLKKLKDFFFEEYDEEDDDELYDDEVENEQDAAFEPIKSSIRKPDFKKDLHFFGKEKEVKEPKKMVETPVETKTTMKDITIERKEETVPTEEFAIKENATPMKFYDVASKPSTFIDLEDSKVETAPIQQEPVRPVPRREMPQKAVEIKDYRNTNKQYEFHTVISPIFGRTGKDAEIFESYETKEAVKHENKDSYLGTVFSPMYVAKEEAPAVKEKKKENNIKVVDNLPPLQDIDDLIEAPIRSKNDDVHQYSLFDEGTDKKDKVEEKVSEKDFSDFFD